MTDRFTVELQQHPSEVVLALAGDLDGTAREALAEAWSRAVAVDHLPIVLDFGSLRYMNSTGIALVVEILGRARAAGRELRARALSDHYRQIFEITRLADFIALEDPTAGATA